MRHELVDTIGEVGGGHFGANLGTCELAVAIHSVLASRRDKVIWDVGHQADPHKILTGRREALKTIRKHGDSRTPFCSIFQSRAGRQHAGGTDVPIVVVLSDNGMSGARGIDQACGRPACSSRSSTSLG